jgi:hypothetical protein
MRAREIPYKESQKESDNSHNSSNDLQCKKRNHEARECVKIADGIMSGSILPFGNQKRF